MKRILISLLSILIITNVHANEEEIGNDIISNMFYEDYFWEERQLTDKETKQAIVFITTIMEEARNGNDIAVRRLMSENSNPTDDDKKTALFCDLYSASSTAYSFYRSQVEYHPNYAKHTVPLYKALKDFKDGNQEDGVPSYQVCKHLKYWMPFVDVINEDYGKPF